MIGDAAGEAVELDLEAVRIAGLRQQRLRLARVVRVGLDARVVSQRPLVHDGRQASTVAEVESLEDGVDVHCVVQRLAHLDVVEGRLAHVDRHVEDAGRRDGLDH